MNLQSFISSFKTLLKQKFEANDEQTIQRKRLFDTRLVFGKILEGLQRGHSLQLLGISSADQVEFAPSSFCVARRKISHLFFDDLSRWIYSYFDKGLVEPYWFGRRIFAIDSTRVSLPKELENDGFTDLGSGCYYPMGVLTSLYDLRLGINYTSLLSQYLDEHYDAVGLLQCLSAGDVVIGDRGYFSFELLFEASRQNIDLIIRVSDKNAPSDLRDFIQSDKYEEVIDLSPSKRVSRKLARHGVQATPVTIRAIKYQISNESFLLVTTLIDEISMNSISKLFNSRWDVEESFKTYKQVLDIENFKTKSLSGVLQELYAAIFLYNFAQALVLASKGPKIKEKSRHNFSLTLIVNYIRVNYMSFYLQSVRKITSLLERVIIKSRYRYRPGRKYKRQSYKPISKWMPPRSMNTG